MKRPLTSNNQRQILWNDPFLKIKWPTKKNLIISTNDINAMLFADI